MATKYSSTASDDDTVDLSLFIDAVRFHWRAFFSCLAGAIAISVLAYALIPSRWEANTTLRIGAVAVVSKSPQLIESTIEAATRVRKERFQTAVFNSTSLAGKLSSTEEALYRRTVKATPVNGTNLIDV